MEIEQKHRLDSLQKLMPKEESRISMILNGVGNGMMVGTIPFVGLMHYADITHKPVSTSLKIGSALATVAGCAIGGWWGAQEAEHLRCYREALADELQHIHERIDAPQTPENKVQHTAANEKLQPNTPSKTL